MLQIAYNLRLKRMVILDIGAIASLPHPPQWWKKVAGIARD
ncbi:MAG: hypothetical protein V7K25_04090 [Nostoc sp.]